MNSPKFPEKDFLPRMTADEGLAFRTYSSGNAKLLSESIFSSLSLSTIQIFPLTVRLRAVALELFDINFEENSFQSMPLMVSTCKLWCMLTFPAVSVGNESSMLTLIFCSEEISIGMSFSTPATKL
jgi:hypothetical protein